MAVANQSLRAGKFICPHEQDTFELGASIGHQLAGGEVLLLSGSLGAGKTLLVKGIAHALGVDEEDVSSPTFTLVNPYQGRLRLYHIDLYRLDTGPSAAHAVDLEEILSDEEAVIAIEWAERLENYPLPANAWRITILGDGSMSRTISIAALDRDHA